MSENVKLPEAVAFIHKESLADLASANYAMETVASNADLGNDFVGMFTADQLRACVTDALAAKEAEIKVLNIQIDALMKEPHPGDKAIVELSALREAVRGLEAKCRERGNSALRNSGTWNGNDMADRYEWLADELAALTNKDTQ